MIYTFYIFDSNGSNLCYKEWNRRKQLDMPQVEEFKLVYGLLASVKRLVAKWSPTHGSDEFYAFSTDSYKLHFYESPTGLKFAATTELNAAPLNATLVECYKLWVKYVASNPFCTYRGTTIDNKAFLARVEAQLQATQTTAVATTNRF